MGQTVEKWMPLHVSTEGGFICTQSYSQKQNRVRLEQILPSLSRPIKTTLHLRFPCVRSNGPFRNRLAQWLLTPEALAGIIKDTHATRLVSLGTPCPGIERANTSNPSRWKGLCLDLHSFAKFEVYGK